MVLPYKELIKLAALQFGEKKGQENQKTSLGSVQKAKEQPETAAHLGGNVNKLKGTSQSEQTTLEKASSYIFNM